MTEIVIKPHQLKPYYNPASKVIFVGQNPAKRAVNILNEMYPFGINPNNPIVVLPKKTGGPHWASLLYASVAEWTGISPSIINLVNVITSDNHITDDIVKEHCEDSINLILKHQLVLCFGNLTYRYVKMYMNNLREKEEINTPRLYTLPHPAYIMRFHRDDKEFQQNTHFLLYSILSQENLVKGIRYAHNF